MSPILLRPVREQLEHDRVIQALQGRWGRRFEVAANLGSSQEATVRVGGTMVCPDLVLTSSKGGRRVEGVIEVETGESVNHLEAMAQWAHLGRVRAPFYLCVPAGAADVARRLCVAHNVGFAEIWSYHSVGDLLRFTMVHRHVTRGRASARAAKAAAAPARKKTSSSPRAAKKSAAKESGRKKPVTRKSATKKKAVKKTAAKKTAAKKTAPKKTAPKKRVAKAAPKRATAQKRRPAARAKTAKSATRAKSSKSVKTKARSTRGSRRK